MLWLLLRATCNAPHTKRAVQNVPVVVHGDLVLPTPESARAWASASEASPYEWQRQGVMLGVGGDLRKPQHAWLAPVSAALAAGRFADLEKDFMKYIDHWDTKGMLEWRSLAAGGAGGDPRGPLLKDVRGPIMSENGDLASGLLQPTSDRQIVLPGLLPLLSSLRVPAE